MVNQMKKLLSLNDVRTIMISKRRGISKKP